MRAWLFPVGVSIVLLAGSPVARAFERSAVDGQPETPLYWQFRTVRVNTAYNSSGDLDSVAVSGAVARSIDTWNMASRGCASDFNLVDDGLPSGLTTNLFDGRYDGENRVVWREDSWPDDVPPDTLALTTSVYRTASGLVLDADIDMNGVHHTWTNVDDPSATQADVENTMTHELGHLLGLAHAPASESTMFASSPPGDLDKRTLSDDDIEGLCFIYPRDRLSPGAPVIPGGTLTSGCSASAATASGVSGWTALVLAFGLALSRRRSRRAKR